MHQGLPASAYIGSWLYKGHEKAFYCISKLRLNRSNPVFKFANQQECTKLICQTSRDPTQLSEQKIVRGVWRSWDKTQSRYSV